MTPHNFPPGHHDRDRYGEYEVLAVDGEYRLVRYADGREERRAVALLRLAALNRQFDADRPPAPPPPAPSKKPPRPQPADKTTPSFEIEETSAAIARLIRELAGDPPQFVPHDAIVAALLADPAGRRLIARARELQGDDRRPEAIAANMVAWFSQKITAKDSAYQRYQREFERKKVAGSWAYRARMKDEGGRMTDDRRTDDRRQTTDDRPLTTDH